MSFLTPLYIAGLLAVSLPLIFHFIRRKPRGQRSFSSLMFLSQSPPRLTRKSRLDHWLLLLLRGLALCLLALAFSRPFLRAAADLDILATEQRRVAILLDTSASMQRADLWRRALAEVDQVLEDVTPVDQLALFSFDGEMRTLVGFDDAGPPGAEGAKALARSCLRRASPTWAATDLGGALTAAAESLEAANDAKPSAAALQIVLVTDLQQGSNLDALNSYQWPEGVQVQIRRVSSPRSTNAGLELAVDSGELDAAAADCRVRVSNAFDSLREEFQLKWSGPAGPLTTAEPLRVYVPPGQSRVFTMEAPPKDSGVDRLLLTGDDHDFDNAHFVAPAERKEVVLLYIGSDSAGDPQGLRYYLERAFSDSFGRKVRVLASGPADPLQTSAATSPRLVVLGEAPHEDRLDPLRRYLRDGGAALYVLQDQDDAASLAKLMDWEGLTAEEADVRDYAMLADIDFAHPLFASLADSRFNDFTKIHFWRYRRVNAGTNPRVRVLAKFDSGDPAVFEYPLDPGRLTVLTSSWRPADSQLALSAGKFIPLLAALLEASGGADAQRPSYHVGQQVTLAGGRGQPVLCSVRKPDGAEVKLAKGSFVFSDADQPGVYLALVAGQQQAFAVNVALSESKTGALELDELEQRGVRVGRRATRAEEIEQVRRKRDVELENGQKLWRWLLAAALAVLIVETWLAGRAARTDAVAAKAMG